MKYSIVIPVYKRTEIFKICLDSISSQLLKPLEVIIVDNNTNNIQSKLLYKLNPK